tara:strand:+ start:2082 stop:2933 length:852 start_codon:yes stop_codon:yes gene_type:complete
MDADTVDAVGQAAEVIVKTSNEFNVPGILLAIGDATGQPVNLVVFALTIATLFAFWVLTRCLGFGGGGGGGSSNTGSSSGDCVLITGACGGGKTAMFQTLRSGEVFLDRTVTSMDVNEARIEVRSEKLGKSKRARLVDLPGHPRLRAKLDRYANGAKAIVFVVDAVDFTSQRRAVAEHLFEILSHPAVQKRRCPIMIACNKSEKITAHPADFVRKRLEKEIEALRTTRGTLEDTVGESGAGAVGLDGAEFAFEHQRSNKVDAAGCAVAGNDLESVREFIVRRG